MKNQSTFKKRENDEKTRKWKKNCEKKKRIRNYENRKYFTTAVVPIGSSISPQISSATNAACNSKLERHIFGDMLTAITVEEGDIVSFIFLRTGRRKCVPTNHRPSKRPIVVRRFYRKMQKKHPFFFLNEPLPGAPRHVSTKFSANTRRIDCVGSI